MFSIYCVYVYFCDFLIASERFFRPKCITSCYLSWERVCSEVVLHLLCARPNKIASTKLTQPSSLNWTMCILNIPYIIYYVLIRLLSVFLFFLLFFVNIRFANEMLLFYYICRSLHISNKHMTNWHFRYHLYTLIFNFVIPDCRSKLRIWDLQ